MSIEKALIPVIKEFLLFFRPLNRMLSVGNKRERFLILSEYLGIDVERIFRDSEVDNLDLESILTLYQRIQSLIEKESLSASDIQKLIKETAGLFDFFDQLKDLNLREGAEQIKGNIGQYFLDALFVNYLVLHHPTWLSALEFIGCLEIIEFDEEPGFYHKMNWKRLSDFLKDPLEASQEVYGWSQNAFDAYLLLDRLHGLLFHFGILSEFHERENDQLQRLGSDVERAVKDLELNIPIIKSYQNNIKTEWGVNLLPITTKEYLFDSKLAIIPYAIGSLNKKTSLQSGFSVIIQTAVDTNNSYSILITPESVKIQALEGGSKPSNVETRLSISKPKIDGIRYHFLGEKDGTRLEVGAIGFGAKIKHDKKLNISILMPIDDALFVLYFGEGDGFLNQVFPRQGIKVNFDFTLEWTIEDGFHFDASGGLEILLPKQFDLGPVQIDSLYLLFGLKDRGFSLVTAMNVNAFLGPFSMTIETVGMKLDLNVDEGLRGNLGLIDLDLGFKPPTGIALSLETSTITGGGYIRFDQKNERYAGALELILRDEIVISAVAIIETRLPDDPDGYSLLILINVAFNPAISLGLNFFLSGLGGMIGLHRTVNAEALRLAVKEDAVDQLLFPEDVVSNIDKIIKDTQQYFPAKQDQFVIGLMALITWNNPPLLRMELGLVIEFKDPTRILILGVLKCLLPKPNKSLVQIQVNFLGVIDFDNKELSFDATLFDSHVVKIALEGDMALRIKWGEKRAFVLSVGGFHPAYTPAAHLKIPPMERLTLSLVNKKNVKLIFTTFFAVTSNTVQFGAAFHLLIRFRKFKIVGELAFDVLFQFSPFRFIAHIKAGIEVKWGSKTLFGVSLSMDLQGPGPWIAKGKAKFKILFIKIKVRFSKTFGKKREASIPGVQLWPLLLESLEQAESWSGEMPPMRQQLARFCKDAKAENALLVHPNGTLSLQQQLVPLGIVFSRYGNYAVEDIQEIRVARIRIGNDTIEMKSDQSDYEILEDFFAPSAYKEMEDDDKLTAPDFEELPNGIKIRHTEGFQTVKGEALNKPFEYEVKASLPDEVISISGPVKAQLENLTIRGERFRNAARQGLLQNSALAQKGIRNRFPAKVKVLQEHYAVVEASNLSQHSGTRVVSSKAEADQILKGILTKEPEKRGVIAVTPDFQLED